MKFILKTKNQFDQKIKFIVPFSTIVDYNKKEIIKIRKNKIINGFRKNKMPVDLIKSKYEKLIQKKVINKIIYKNFNKIIADKKISIINQPKIIINQYKENYDFIYSIYFQSIPTIDINKIKNITIKKLSITNNETDLKYYIEYIRNNHITWEEIQDKIKKNDKITIKYHIKYNENNTLIKTDKKIFTFINNKKQIIPQIYKNIINKKKGDIFFLTIKLPSNYPLITLQRKKIEIKIQIIQIQRKKIIYSQKQFIEYLNKKFQTTDIKKIYFILKSKLEEEKNYIIHKYTNNQIKKQIIKLYNLDIPKKIIKNEIKIIHQKLNEKYNQKYEYIFQLKYHKNINSTIYKKFKLEFFITSIINHYDIIVTQKEIQKYIRNTPFNHKKSIVKNIYNILLNDKVNQILLKIFQIKKHPCTFPKIMKQMFL
ncbi:Trigger factor [Buchnera aphidicola (Pterocallis alni)]|uniref:trigger factor n=1 Tax=Buchnera aphidicola TaxID=9 RepID=UPI003463CAC8